MNMSGGCDVCTVTAFVSTGASLSVARVFRVGTLWPIIISLLRTRGGGVVHHKTTCRERATIELHDS